MVKTESSGKYIQSKLIVVPEDLTLINNNNNINNATNENNATSKDNNSTNNNTTDNKDNLSQYISQSSGEKDIISINSGKSNNNTVKNAEEEKIEKQKIFHDIIQQSNLGNPSKNNNSNNSNQNEISNTITIKNDNLVNILEKNQISIRWCKICNMILPSDLEPSTHIKGNEHQKLVKEYNLSIQEESNTIMLFKSIPGNINEELKKKE